MPKKISASIALDGASQYTQQIRTINAAQKELRSEMKATDAQFKTSANSLEALKSKQQILSAQYQVSSAKVKHYESAVETATAKEQKAADALETMKRKYADAERELDDMKKSTDASADAIEEQEQKLSELGAQLTLAERNYDNAQRSTMRYQTSLNNANAELSEIDAELQQNAQYLQEAENSADHTAKSIDQYGNAVGEAEQETSQFGNTMLAVFTANAVYDGLKTLVSGIKEIAAACVETGAEFEAAMSKVAAVSGATGSDLDALTQKAKDLGATTMFSASEAAEAMNYMAMAGWKTEDMLSGIDGVMGLAAASGTDLATTSDIVTDALTAFGLTAEDSAHFADVLAAASSNANTNVEMMGETFKYAAPIAGALGYSTEDTAEAIGLMANAGIKASASGTALRRIMTELSSGISFTSKTLGEVNISATNADGTMKGLSQILGECRDAFTRMNDAGENTAIVAENLVGKNALGGFLALMQAAPADVDKLSTALANCDGVAASMADTMQDNLQGKLKILQSTLEALKISTYEAFDDSLKDGVDGATDALARLNEAIVDGDLGVSLERLGNSASMLITEVVDGLVEHMPQIVNGLSVLIDNADEMVGVLSTLIQVWGTYKIATEGAKVATQLLNAEMVVNPIIAVAEAVLICGNAMVGLARNAALAGEANLKASQQMSPLAKETKKITDSVNESKEAFQTSISDIEAQGSACQTLADQLIELNTQYQDTSAEGYSEGLRQQQGIIAELNAAYPGLNLAINEQTGALNMSSDAIQRNIEAMQQQAYAEAAQERLTEIAKQKLELQTQQQKLLPELTEAENTLTDTLNAQAEAQKAYDDEVERYNNYDVVSNLEAATEAHLEAGHSLAELRQQNAECETAVEELNEEERILTEQLTANAQASTTAGEAAGSAAAGIDAMKLSEEELSTFMESVNSAIDSQINLFERHSAETAVSGEEMKSNLESQTEALTQWAEDFEALASKGIDDGLLKSLAEMGPQAEGYIQGLLSMSDAELSEYSSKFAEAMKLKDETVVEITDSYLSAGQDMGKALGEGIIEGTEEGTDDVASAAEETVKTAKEAGEKQTDDFSDVGKEAMNATQKGIKDNQTEVTTAVEDVGKEALKTAQKAMGKDKFESVGVQMMAGIVAGMNSEEGKGTLLATMKSIASEAVKAAQAELEIKSPSRVFRRIGQYTMQGMAEGVTDSSTEVIDAVNRAMVETSRAGASVATAQSGMDTASLGTAISSAIERGLEGFVLNVNAGVDKDAIVRITVDANNETIKRTGSSAYAGG